jgi:hypothetical protein
VVRERAQKISENSSSWRMFNEYISNFKLLGRDKENIRE